MQTLKSEIDSSVNFVLDYKGGQVEARYVRRDPSYIICYLSSQTGCNRGCTFCHLTETRQTDFEQVDADCFLDQALTVLMHYDKVKGVERPASLINFNWMSRGEALCNPTLTEDSYETLDELRSVASARGLTARFNVSTIYPKSFKGGLVKAFPKITPTIYYSFYSTDDEFRDKWMPGALPFEKALTRLREYQLATDKIIKIHGAFIKGENDSDDNIFALANALTDWDITCDFNIVRYNPPNTLSEESDRLPRIEHILSRYLKGRVKIVEKVGYDVKASCGMFVNTR